MMRPSSGSRSALSKSLARRRAFVASGLSKKPLPALPASLPPPSPLPPPPSPLPPPPPPSRPGSGIAVGVGVGVLACWLSTDLASLGSSSWRSCLRPRLPLPLSPSPFDLSLFSRWCLRSSLGSLSRLASRFLSLPPSRSLSAWSLPPRSSLRLLFLRAARLLAMPAASSDAAETWVTVLKIRLNQGCQRQGECGRPVSCSRINPSLAPPSRRREPRRVRGAARSILHADPAGTLPL